VHVDLRELELFQRKADAEGKPFGEETKNETQNQHAREWLEIGADAPADALKKNALIEFSLREIKDLSATDLGKLKGAERKVTFTAIGEFLLHQRKASKSVQLEATFAYAGDATLPPRVHVKSLEPLEIGLDEYDVHPREGVWQARRQDPAGPLAQGRQGGRRAPRVHRQAGARRQGPPCSPPPLARPRRSRVSRPPAPRTPTKAPAKAG
jgi:hypothetical protein